MDTLNRRLKLRLLHLILSFLIAGLAESSVLAAVPSEALIGEWNSFGVAGATGFVGGLNQAGGGGGGTGIGQFGFDFHGLSRVDSITFTQNTSGSRHRPQNVTVYTSPTQSFNFELEDTQLSQTITFPAPVETSYFYVGVNSKYTTGSSDPNWGVQTLSVGGVRRPHFDVNQVAGTAQSSVTASGLLNAGSFPISRVVDGTLYASSTNTAAYFVRNNDASQDSLTIPFSSPRTITSIGLGLELGGGARDIPKFVNVIDSNNNSQALSLGADPTQYGRYTLTTPILSTTSLTIQFPAGNSTSWYLHGDANHGITEVQAFDTPTIYAQITDPLVTASSTPYSGSYIAANAFNNDGAASQYASASLGANTFMDFDFGQARRMNAFAFQPRSINNFDEVWTSNLIFSNDPTFTTNIATITIDHQRTTAVETMYPFPDQTARYVRWDVTQVPAANGNTGAGEIGFYATVPSYHTQAPTPTVTNSSAAFSGAYAVSRLFDNDLDTDYASAALGTATFVDLDFGSPQTFAGVEFIDRLPPADWIGSFRLIFSTDSTFGNGDDTFLDFSSQSAAYETFPAHIARYVRFDVLTAGGFSNNFGGRELIFYSPEPNSLLMLLVGSMALAMSRRKRSAT